MMNLDEILKNETLWQMSYAEKASIFYLLDKMKNRGVAIEIGTYHGGFLKVLSRYFDKVYSCDIDHSNVDNKDSYKNITWIEGDSKETLPKLIEQINNNGEDVNFILVDGDHGYETALQDINNVLKYVPKNETVILIHDSWYSPSREAINQADWNSNLFVHLVEKDFCTGDIIYSATEGNIFVGGLAIAILSNMERENDIEIGQTYDYMYLVVNNLLNKK
jgi:hypothetical protein